MRASHEYFDLEDADVILVCVQTDRRNHGPDYGPLQDALFGITASLKQKRPRQAPLVIFESTLAPTTMITVIKEHFAQNGLRDGRDVFLGNSPNRVMPGHLVERIRTSDKIIGGMNSKTPPMIGALYSKIVTGGALHLTNSLTAEIVKTLENAYRDVRIAYTSEIARYCDAQDLDFYRVRREVNRKLGWSDRASEEPRSVPMGGLMIPTVGVGGHCLPKDGYLLLWRQMEDSQDMAGSLILEARRINDESPAVTLSVMERTFGKFDHQTVALMGVAYRPNSEDARYSPTFDLGRQLLQKGCQVILHDFYVKPDDPSLVNSGMDKFFSQDMERALSSARFAVFCTAHQGYCDERKRILRLFLGRGTLFDGCNLFPPANFPETSHRWGGIGRGQARPPKEFIDFVHKGFQAVETGVANEVQGLIQFLDERYAGDDFNRLDFCEIQKLAQTCPTGCRIPDPAPVMTLPQYSWFYSRLAQRAHESFHKKGIPSQSHE